MELTPGRDTVFGSWPDGRPISPDSVSMRQQPHRRRARADTYDDDVADLICDRLGNGETIHEICEDAAMPSATTVSRWKKSHPEFKEMYDDALAVHFEKTCDKLDKIAAGGADDYETDPESTEGKVREKPEALGRSKLRIEQIKYRMEKHMPRIYAPAPPVAAVAPVEAAPAAITAPVARALTVQDGVETFRENLRLVGK
jgi:hypothetical protein